MSGRLTPFQGALSPDKLGEPTLKTVDQLVQATGVPQSKGRKHSGRNKQPWKTGIGITAKAGTRELHINMTIKQRRALKKSKEEKRVEKVMETRKKKKVKCSSETESHIGSHLLKE